MSDIRVFVFVVPPEGHMVSDKDEMLARKIVFWLHTGPVDCQGFPLTGSIAFG